ncbi:tRNA (adenosine(37)-N6)-threonylcarbamoyltransferase complex dimerization subunit type 1 TsaB [Aquabacterium sp. J223]|uniref:tRNA (adenosine(37)-N6)-threonylcarbamoyltransferase complex dimerization subunit type 1 TsaB n=1 Tax=Aquabacterium sp. J223 TaxID=2898431 RepID=UPI0021AE0C7A|nr:tRNA (adenosine(37)-N6)-threonylcarbamoyltransferase complex dimerization subunit type 1 TsaB [Aquabacterium sp. J223]UUX96437.1 tRNA (adenosine(37)-N6)-threonylcarbamoyltransferase complex dimerization subunit type 1 TsaB [Aquabacterium sp. J223]
MLDTAGERLCVALCEPSGARRWHDEAGGPRASARLLPVARGLLDAAGLTWARLDGIAFGRGPGAFTGLRTACSVAQGLGFGLDRPLLPLDCLMLVAEAARLEAAAGDPARLAAPPGEDFACWAAVDARMDEIYAAAYGRRAGAWQVIAAPALYAADALAARWRADAPAVAAGNALSRFAGRLPSPARAVDGDARRAEALATLALERWALGEAVPAEQALPLYLRDKVALTTAERAQRPAPATAGAAAPTAS